MKIITKITLAVAMSAVAFLSGCATTPGYQRADNTSTDIAEFRREVIKTSAAVNQTMNALDEVAATADINPRPAYQQFKTSLAELDSAAANAKKRRQDMREQGQVYFQRWEEDMASIQDREIRGLAEQRKAQLKEAFTGIRKYSEPLDAQFDPWLSDLKDLQTFLSNDLTIAGVDAAKSRFAKAQTEGLEVQRSMDALVAELNTVAATLTPARVKTN